MNMNLASNSTGETLQKEQLVPANVNSSSKTVKVDKDDIRAKRHYFKTTFIDGKEYRSWECGLCGKDFKYQYTLIRHIPTHTDVRNFHCNVCSKSFRQMSTLAQHKATHWEVRPFKCEICSKSFNRVSTLISHKKIHTDEKKHICSFCGKGFHQKGNLKNHMYTHTNERPYKCDICNKGFNQKSNLVVHKNSTHLKKNEINKTHINFYQKLPDTKLVTEPVDNKESFGAGNPGVASQINRVGSKNTILMKENIENAVLTLHLNIEPPIVFINKKPSPEMLECFVKNVIPFVLFFKAGQSTSVIYKAVMDGDHYALMNPCYEDISHYRSYSKKSTIQIPIVNVINEYIQNDQFKYIVKPFKITSAAQKSFNIRGEQSQSSMTNSLNIPVTKSPILQQKTSMPSVKKEEIVEKFNHVPDPNIVKEEQFEEDDNVLTMDNDPVIISSSSPFYNDLELDAKIEESILNGGINFLDLLNDPAGDLIS